MCLRGRELGGLDVELFCLLGGLSVATSVGIFSVATDGSFFFLSFANNRARLELRQPFGFFFFL